MARWPRLGLVLVPFLALGCDPNAIMSGSEEGSKKGPSEAPVPAVEDAKEPEVLQADLGTSTIGFAVAKATGEHIAEFEDFEATLTLEDGKPKQLDVVIQMASVRSDRSGLTKHLKSADFFDVARFPTSTFTATTFRTNRAEAFTHDVEGVLSFHGVDKDLGFPAKIDISATKAEGVADLTIKPTDFGINYPGLVEELVATDVLLEIQLRFPRPAAAK